MQPPKVALPKREKAGSKVAKFVEIVLAVFAFCGGLATLVGTFSLLLWPLMQGILKPYGLTWSFWQAVYAACIFVIFAIITSVIVSTNKGVK